MNAKLIVIDLNHVATRERNSSTAFYSTSNNKHRRKIVEGNYSVRPYFTGHI